MEYQQYVRDCMKDRRDNLERKVDTETMMLEMVGELGETINAIKHYRMWKYRDGSADTRQHVVEELGDMLWYFTAVCATLDITLEEVMSTNMTKLNERYGEVSDVKPIEESGSTT